MVQMVNHPLIQFWTLCLGEPLEKQMLVFSPWGHKASDMTHLHMQPMHAETVKQILMTLWNPLVFSMIQTPIKFYLKIKWLIIPVFFFLSYCFSLSLFFNLSSTNFYILGHFPFSYIWIKSFPCQPFTFDIQSS